MKKESIKLNHRIIISFSALLILGIILAQSALFQPILQAADKFKIGDTVSVTATSLNVRSNPGTGSPSLGSQKINTTGVIVAGPKSANGFYWWQINYISGPDGWSADTYLRLAPVAQSSTATKFSIQSRISVNTATLNVRSNAGIGASVLGTQKSGAAGTIIGGPKIENSTNWWQINYDQGADGWSSQAYLKYLSPPSSVSPPNAQIPLNWGAYAGNNPGDLEAFEKLVGKDVDIQAVFVGWNDPFPEDIATRLKNEGKTLLVFWEPYSATLNSINQGYSDEYIASFAAAAKKHNSPIILAPFHEMNGNWDPWGGFDQNNRQINKPELIIAVWRKIHNAFQSVPNVKFAWAINNDSVPDTAANAASVYYPGDAYVDYVGVDGFNFGSPWKDFSSVFDDAMQQLADYQKPIYIFSTASTAGSEKAAWIKDGLGIKVKQYKNIAGWVWFNQNGPDRNWLISSDPASLAAFKAVIP